jgi:membrane protein
MSYNKTYGSLGAAIGFMTWMWLSSAVVLLGAELDAEIWSTKLRETRPLALRSRWAGAAHK